MAHNREGGGYQLTRTRSPRRSLDLDQRFEHGSGDVALWLGAFGWIVASWSGQPVSPQRGSTEHSFGAERLGGVDLDGAAGWRPCGEERYCEKNGSRCAKCQWIGWVDAH